MKLPTKEEIRRKYNIAESDFAVLTTSKLPSPESLRQEGAQIDKLGVWDRYAVWKKSTIAGSILAIIIEIGNLYGGWTALRQIGSSTYTTLAPFSAYVSNFLPYPMFVSTDPEEHRAFPPMQQNDKREKWAVLVATSGIQVNSITPSSGLS